MAVLNVDSSGGRLLVLNPGSSTLKFGLYQMPDGEERASGIVDRLGTPQAALRLTVEGQPPAQEPLSASSPGEAAEAVLRHLTTGRQDALGAIGCRVVHGGTRFVEPTRVTPAVLEGIRALAPLAPLHNPPAADVLETCLRLLLDVPAVAVFDTAFHQTLPPVARTYALPHELCERHGLRRYGFHGIAHRQVCHVLRARLSACGAPAARLVNCHLGSGASICAIHDGQSIDTSMGMTPMEGLVMGTRAGDVDPGLLLYLLREEAGMTPDTLDELLNRQSGLLGVSAGRSGDVRDLERAASEGDAPSRLALDLFAYRVAKTVGAYAVALEGLDALAFSGGIGEHGAAMRRRICRRLACLGLTLDEARNAAATNGREPTPISTHGSQVQAWVVPADENRQIARETWDLLQSCR